MKNIDTDGVTKRSVSKKKNILDKYQRRNVNGWEINPDRFNVLGIIGGDLESKTLYSDNSIRMSWRGIKKSGAHKIDTGIISFLDTSSGEKVVAINVEGGYAKKITIYRKSFAENIDNYKNMPLLLYSYLKETFV